MVAVDPGRRSAWILRLGFLVLLAAGVGAAVWVWAAFPAYAAWLGGLPRWAANAVSACFTLPFLALLVPLYRYLGRRDEQAREASPVASWARANGFAFEASVDEPDLDVAGAAVTGAANTFGIVSFTDMVTGDWAGHAFWSFVCTVTDSGMTKYPAVVMRLPVSWPVELDASRRRNLVRSKPRQTDGWYLTATGDDDQECAETALASLRDSGFWAALVVSDLPADAAFRTTETNSHYAAICLDWTPDPARLIPTALNVLRTFADRMPEKPG